jgi:hypothetical protein
VGSQSQKKRVIMWCILNFFFFFVKTGFKLRK